MKGARQKKIVELIRKYDIDTQEELAERLKEAGFRVTQATVSRDIRSLSITKMTGADGRTRYAILNDKEEIPGFRYSSVMHDAVHSVDSAQNLVVIRTSPGMAMAAAAALDDLRWPEVLGSIAGDDTIMCAVRTEEEAVLIKERVEAMIR
ncbi:MAG: arginine repressor [Blautia sp.]|nr:arginine repressor [Blautia sp.]